MLNTDEYPLALGKAVSKKNREDLKTPGEICIYMHIYMLCMYAYIYVGVFIYV
jgi:hypothetical protein